MTKIPSPTKKTPDELLKSLHDGLSILGLGEIRRALDDTLAEPGREESRHAWLWPRSRAARRQRKRPRPSSDYTRS